MNLNKLKSSELKSAIYGMVLGDAGLSISGKRGINYRLYFGHSTKQKAYALWKKDIIDQIGTVNSSTYEYVHPIKNYESIRITTNARRYFTKIAKNFYDKKTKILSKKSLDKLNNLGLAIWYMDDGSLQKRGNSYRAAIHTESFTYEENLIIQDWFFEKYSIETKIQKTQKKNGSVYYFQVFNTVACKELLSIVTPFVKQVSCMKHKIKDS